MQTVNTVLFHLDEQGRDVEGEREERRGEGGVWGERGEEKERRMREEEYERLKLRKGERGLENESIQYIHVHTCTCMCVNGTCTHTMS